MIHEYVVAVNKTHVFFRAPHQDKDSFVVRLREFVNSLQPTVQCTWIRIAPGNDTQGAWRVARSDYGRMLPFLTDSEQTIPTSTERSVQCSSSAYHGMHFPCIRCGKETAIECSTCGARWRFENQCSTENSIDIYADIMESARIIGMPMKKRRQQSTNASHQNNRAIG